MTESLLLKSYLEEFGDDDDIKEMLKNNKCNVLPYTKLTKDTILSNYDYIAIFSDEEFIDLVDCHNDLYQKIYNKIYFLHDYDCEFVEKYRNELSKIKNLGLIFNKELEHDNIFNNTKNITLLDSCPDYSLYWLMYLPSSLKTINVGCYNKKYINNLPNKIVFMVVTGYYYHEEHKHSSCFLKIKLPKNIIVTFYRDYRHIDDTVNKILKIKTKKTLLRILEPFDILEDKTENGFLETTIPSIIKSNGNLKILYNIYRYEHIYFKEKRDYGCTSGEYLPGCSPRDMYKYKNFVSTIEGTEKLDLLKNDFSQYENLLCVKSNDNVYDIEGRFNCNDCTKQTYKCYWDRKINVVDINFKRKLEDIDEVINKINDDCYYQHSGKPKSPCKN
jgi:hypothetical protein